MSDLDSLDAVADTPGRPDPVPPELAEEVVTEHGGDLFESAAAVFDRTRRYRYLLTRVWSTTAAPPLVICMVNPSTADAHQADPTIAR